MNNESTTHTRIRKTTLKNLRRIYAETGEAMVEILDRLIEAELQKIHDDNLQIQTVSESEKPNTGQQD